MSKVKKEAVVVHSGGMDSSICLALAIEEFGAENVLSLSFSYGQRHSLELERAAGFCESWGVDHTVISIDCLQEITSNALMDSDAEIESFPDEAPNTLVEGRNGLMARIAAIHTKSLLGRCIYMGVIEVEAANSGYRDCSRHYMNLMEEIMRLDLGLPNFEIRTPLVGMTKCETLVEAERLGVLVELLENSVTCYKGLPHAGCGECPACELRNAGIRDYLSLHPELGTKVAWLANLVG